MPHLCFRIEADRGPILRLLIGVSRQRLLSLEAAGLPVPDPILVDFLVDTGASNTAVDLDITDRLGLAPSEEMQVYTPSTGVEGERRFTYDIGLLLRHSDHTRVFPLLSVIGTDFRGQDVDGLLGRDVLASCLFVYDGAQGTFTLAF